MRYLIDTHWIASYLNGRTEAVNLFASIEQEDLAISQVTYGEIYEGIYVGQDPQRYERAFREVLRAVDVFPLTQTIWRRFARLRGELRQQGQLIADLDLLIAATALQHDCLLLTRNRRHFERIPQLQLQ
jgi:tRNA(fMet)-specific endonuclease VapC